MLTNKNIEKLQTMAQDFLQYRYKIFCNMGRRDADWTYYEGALDMIKAFGGTWKRFYKGDDTEEQKNDPSYYFHSVIFPNKEHCERLNEDAWK